MLPGAWQTGIAPCAALTLKYRTFFGVATAKPPQIA